MKSIDRRSALPLYYQLAQMLRQQLQSGEIEAGARLPSERELMQTYKLSRNTVRQAIDQLVEEGLAYRDHGRGNFYFSAGLKIQYKIDTFVEHSEFIRRGGQVPAVRHIETRDMPASDVVRSALNLAPDEPVVRFVKLFLANQKPAILAYDYIPLKLLGDQYDPAGAGETFFAFLEEKSGHQIDFVLSGIIASTTSKDIARYLALPPNSPIVQLQEIFLDPSQDKPLAFACNYYHPDIQFRILRRRV